MAELYGVDLSQFNGAPDWDKLNEVTNFVLIRASDGTIEDLQFKRNQSEARRVRADAGPLGIGYYTHTYPTLLTPQESADSFVDLVGTLQPGEVLAHDLEGNIGPDPVAWSLAFMQAVLAKTSVRMLIYLNKSEVASYDWSPLIEAGFGLWLADYSGSKTSPVPPTPWPVVALRQWSNTDQVAGIGGRVDGDTFYGDFDQFYNYGLRATPSATATTAEPAPAPIAETPPSTDQASSTSSKVAESGAVTTDPGSPSSNPTPVPVHVVTPSTTDIMHKLEAIEASLANDGEQIVSWVATTWGGLIVRLAGGTVGYLVAHYSGSLHLNDIAASIVGVILGQTAQDSANPNVPNSTKTP